MIEARISARESAVTAGSWFFVLGWRLHGVWCWCGGNGLRGRCGFCGGRRLRVCGHVRHGQRGVPNLFHECLDGCAVGADGLIRDLVEQVRCALFGEALLEVVRQERLQLLRHPDQALESAFGEEELLGSQEDLAAPHEAGGLLAAADVAGER